MHTHRVHSLQPIANRIAGPLNKRGCIAVGLPMNKNLTFKLTGSCLTQDIALYYISMLEYDHLDTTISFNDN